MEFFISQGATDPILKMRLIDDGKNDKSLFNDLLENADIKFEMFDVKNGEYSIIGGQCDITLRIKKNEVLNQKFIEKIIKNLSNNFLIIIIRIMLTK